MSGNDSIEQQLLEGPEEAWNDPVLAILQAAGITDLTEAGWSHSKLEEVLRNLAALLAGADSLRRATVREAALQKMEGIGIKAPAKLLDAALSQSAASKPIEVGQDITFQDPEPWPDNVETSELLTEIATFVERFVVLPPHAAKTLALWILHTHILEVLDISPLLAITSPTKRAGKTTLVEIVSMLAPRAVSASNITPAALFRAIEKFKPTLLIDEADTFLRESDELRGLLNAGHRRASAFVIRTVGDEHEPRLFSTWCAKVIALIGKLAGTLEDRSIIIQMRRRVATEEIERFRPGYIRAECEKVRRKATRWKTDHLNTLREIDPLMPAGLNDRAADNWRPLIAVAEVAGGDWPIWGKDAALALSGVVDEAENSALVQLLDDLRALFVSRSADHLTSADIVATLGVMEERPWSEWRRGKPLTQTQLARLLAPLFITPRNKRNDDKVLKGYFLSQFTDPFARYLTLSSATSLQANDSIELPLIFEPLPESTVAARKNGLTTQEQREVAAVAGQKGGIRLFGGSNGSDSDRNGVVLCENCNAEMVQKSQAGRWECPHGCGYWEEYEG